MRHPSFDAYWQAMQPYAKEFARIRIPVLSLSGYFDGAGAAAVNYLVDHYRHFPGAEHYLFIGPWTHGENLSAGKSAAVNGYTIDPASNIDTEALTYQWFDHVLRARTSPGAARGPHQLRGHGSECVGPRTVHREDGEPDAAPVPHLAAGGQALRTLATQPSADEYVAQSVDLADERRAITCIP
jgi:predicted acyl esterase